MRSLGSLGDTMCAIACLPRRSFVGLRRMSTRGPRRCITNRKLRGWVMRTRSRFVSALLPSSLLLESPSTHAAGADLGTDPASAGTLARPHLDSDGTKAAIGTARPGSVAVSAFSGRRYAEQPVSGFPRHAPRIQAKGCIGLCLLPMAERESLETIGKQQAGGQYRGYALIGFSNAWTSVEHGEVCCQDVGGTRSLVENT